MMHRYAYQLLQSIVIKYSLSETIIPKNPNITNSAALYSPLTE
jgi:hypothetical protein